MTYKIKYLPLAVQDLNDIARYLSGFYPKTASRVLKELREHHQEGIPRIGGHADAADGRREVFGTIPWHKKLEEIGLNQAYQGHGCCCHTWGIGKDVDTEAQGKAP